MRDTFAFTKFLVLFTLAVSINTDYLNKSKNFCHDLIEANKIFALLENFNFEAEEISDNTQYSLLDLKDYFSEYQGKIISDDVGEITDSFSFTEKNISCKVTLKLTSPTLNSKRTLQSRCEKNNECHTGASYVATECTDRFQDGIQRYTTTTNGGQCVDNICQLASNTATKLVLTKNRALKRDTTSGLEGNCLCVEPDLCLDSTAFLCIAARAGKISDKNGTECRASKCTDTAKCYDETFQCRAPLTTENISAVTGVCYSKVCLNTQYTITKDMNQFTVDLSVSGDNVTVKFTDTLSVLSQVDPDRYYWIVYLTDEKGNFKGTAPTYIKGTKQKVNVTPVSITVTEAQITANCDKVDTSNDYYGRVCYFMAIVADDCSYLKDLMIYTHLAKRIFNIDGKGIYALEPELNVASQFEDIRIDYCSYVVDDCTLSTDYTYTADFCPSTGTGGCASPLAGTYKYKRGDSVHVRVDFSRIDMMAFTKVFRLRSAKTKLFDINGVAIDVAEKDITIGSQASSGDYLYFTFVLTPSYLFYDDETLISNILKLLMIIEISDTRRVLEVGVNTREIVPQLGSLLQLDIDEQDLTEYKATVKNEKSNSDKKKIIIAVVCSVVGFLLICLGFLLYFCLLKKDKKDNKVDESPVNQVSTMGDKVEPEQIQIQEAEVNVNQ